MKTKKFNQELKRKFEEALNISGLKNKDYADKDDPFKNFRLSASISGVSVERGIMVRIADKVIRISNLLGRKNSVKDEKISDTLKDLKNYANILDVYLDNK